MKGCFKNVGESFGNTALLSRVKILTHQKQSIKPARDLWKQCDGKPGRDLWKQCDGKKFLRVEKLLLRSILLRFGATNV